MKLFSLTASCLVAALAVASAQPVIAQTNGAELSADELRALFKKQKTRGLVIAPQSQTPDAGVAAEGTIVQPEVVAAAPEAVPEIEALPEDIQINVAIKFDFNSSALRADQKVKLTNLCTVIGETENEVFRIIGHTDSSGSAQYNATLSTLRAEEVKRHFVDQCGIPAARLLAVGVGEDQPLNKENTRAEENRRVEFQIVS